ncbi:MAG: CHAT domain-containing protein [Gemmatimonadaceae bacterium]|nr:CHAT domain-containing protein [Gemmatimonadaceae bacterium]
MRRLSCVVGLLACAASSLQGQGRGEESLPPREFVRLAMRARVTDSVPAAERAWRQWAQNQPDAVAPRFALGLLARYDQRYRESLAWLDSARTLSTAPIWRNAVAREQMMTQLIQGEFGGVPALLETIMADSAAIPLGEWAEARYLKLYHQRRTGRQVTLAALDSIESMTTAPDTLLRARVTCLRASVDPARRTEHAEAAITLANAARASFISGNCEMLIGTLYAGSGESQNAMRWFERAEKTARAAHDAATLAGTLQWHGYTLSTLGYVPQAMTKLADAIRVSQRIEDRNIEAWALLGIANSATQIGDATTASTALRRAAILFDATSDRYGAWNARLQEATALIQLGDLTGAERLARAARLVGDSIRQPSLSLRALYAMGDVALRTNRFDETHALLDTAAVVIRGMGERFETQLSSYRGLLALNRGEYAASIKLLETPGFSKSQDLFRYAVDGALALAWLRSGDSVRAARRLIDANNDLDRLRDTIAVEGRRRVVTPPDSWGRSSANIDLVLASFVTSRRWLPTVFAVTERTRARALLKGTFGEVGSDTSSAMQEARRRVRASATSVREVQRSLAPGTAMLVYAGGSAPARTSLMIITNTSAKGITLAPLDSLDRDIVRWLALLESGETGAGAGRQVAAAVLSTALRGLPARIKRLVIVPQGPLYRVPFQALPFGPGVLGDRAVVTIAPSVSLALAYAEAPRSVQASVLALGAGDTEVQSMIPQTLELNIERAQRGNPLAPLKAAADEARAAAGWGTASLALTGPDASEAALKREARGGYSVLHAAAHALTSDQALGANYLILRPDSTDDGYVSGGELAALSAGRAMVVLSGCRTTGDFGSRGDAIDGLVAPLLSRGVRTVVASHWAVSDRWTRVLMERFYQNLAAGATTAEAMNTAQMSLRRENVPARFWAAFSVIGDGALTFAPRATSAAGR